MPSQPVSFAEPHPSPHRPSLLAFNRFSASQAIFWRSNLQAPPASTVERTPAPPRNHLSAQVTQYGISRLEGKQAYGNAHRQARSSPEQRHRFRKNVLAATRADRRRHDMRAGLIQIESPCRLRGRAGEHAVSGRRACARQPNCRAPAGNAPSDRRSRCAASESAAKASRPRPEPNTTRRCGRAVR